MLLHPSKASREPPELGIVSPEFFKPKSGRIAVKVINHLGDNMRKVCGVS